MNFKNHWEKIYTEKKSTEVTWFQTKPTLSLELIKSTALSKKMSIIDVGGGSSNLIDFLLLENYSDLTVFDLSHNALSDSRHRLRINEKKVNWIEGDITNYNFNKKFNLWHDRAVFHFFTTQKLQDMYTNTLNNSLDKKGFFIISTFAEDGPLKCSGLNIKRYSKDEMINIFKPFFNCNNFF